MKCKVFGFALIFLLQVAVCLGQGRSEKIEIQGAVLDSKYFSISDLQKFESKSIDDVPITNHAGEPRGIAKALKGFPVKMLFENVVFDTSSPKFLSEFYLIFEARDGYRVVFSWNELFNNPLGDQVYIICAMEGKNMEEMEEGILLLSPSDTRTGRRHVKNLSKIIIQRAD